jgi:hypothetical protein
MIPLLDGGVCVRLPQLPYLCSSLLCSSLFPLVFFASVFFAFSDVRLYAQEWHEVFEVGW